jgi:hypothetical protein
MLKPFSQYHIMIYKINKERRCSKNGTPHDPTTRFSGKEPRRTPNKNITGRKAEDFPERGGCRTKAITFHQDSAYRHTSKNAIFSQRMSN